MIAGLLIVASFALCAGLMIARVVPALVAVPLLALLMGACAGVGWGGLQTIVVDGSVALAAVYATVIFGAFLGRVTMETGIAETIVNAAAEFGGDRPLVLALVLCAAVAVLFTTLTGLGAIIMVGSIVLPIMMTVGVPRSTAATLFLLAFALGFVFNIAQWTFYTQLFGVAPGAMQGFALVLCGLQILAIAAFVAVRARATRDYATWVIAAGEELTEKRRGVPPWALVTPVLPLVFYVAAHASALVAFGLSALYGTLATRPRRAARVLVASAIRGVEDVAPAVLLMMGIGMLLTAARLPAVAAALGSIVAPLAPRGPLGYVVLFGLLSPLALYRGPLNPYGVGIGVYTVLATLHALPPLALVAAVMAVVQVQNACDPTNTQNVWVANFTGVGVDRILRLALPYQVAVATAGCLAFALGGSLHVALPRAWIAPAAARPPPSGLYAPDAARGIVGVGTDGSPDAKVAAAAALPALQLLGWHTIAAARGPEGTDCARKPYAAYLRYESSSSQMLEGRIVDVGVALLDCAGWPVDEWWGQVTLAHPDPAAIAREGVATVGRLRDWIAFHPALARAVVASGVAFVPGVTPPTYFYTLFTTVDGNLRAWVRPGGPAYAAGLRTDDVVLQIDGRWWWEYGTYQSQLLAYDGKPHTFLVVRAGRRLTVALDAPLR